jgi:hypothetical protein
MGQGPNPCSCHDEQMGPEQQAAKRDLDGVADKTHSDGGSDEAVADAIAGAAKLTVPCFSTIRSISLPRCG